MRNEEGIKKVLLQEVENKPVRGFVQIDAFKDLEVYWGGVLELRNTDIPVRVQIHESARREIVIQGLTKILGYLRDNWPDIEGIVETEWRRRATFTKQCRGQELYEAWLQDLSDEDKAAVELAVKGRHGPDDIPF